MSFLERVEAISALCLYRPWLKPGYSMDVRHDAVQARVNGWPDQPEPRVYIQVVATIPDVVTGEMSTQKSGKHYLSEFMTDTEIVRKIFGAYEMFDRHEIFEAFTYKGARIFGPHIDVDALVEISERVSVR